MWEVEIVSNAAASKGVLQKSQKECRLLDMWRNDGKHSFGVGLWWVVALESILSIHDELRISDSLYITVRLILHVYVYWTMCVAW